MSPDEKPRNMAEYRSWLQKDHGLPISEAIINHYDAVVARVERDFRESDFWMRLEDSLQPFHEQYLVETGYPLLREFDRRELKTKKFSAFLMKTFRRNVLTNANWPAAPPGGWLLHPTWFSDVNDLVRTRFEVKYLDGVRFIASKLKDLGEEFGFTMALSTEAKPEGYYAAHLDARRDFEVPKINWNTERTPISIELQVTTQLQEVILSLTHKFYEERRSRAHPPDETGWQWDYRSEEFAANYLGHILHYVEGMIMEVREGRGT
jgi:hypothetical protein